MRVQDLGPHSYPSSGPHPRHHEWLSHFSPRQRRGLIEEDYHARTATFGIITAALVFGAVGVMGVLMVVLATA